MTRQSADILRHGRRIIRAVDTQSTRGITDEHTMLIVGLGAYDDTVAG